MDPLYGNIHKTFLQKQLFMKVKNRIGNLKYMGFLKITKWPIWLKTRKLPLHGKIMALSVPKL